MSEVKINIDKLDDEKSKRPDVLGCVSVMLMVSTIIISLFVHEVGHVIALNILGIPARLTFEIREAGPCLLTEGAYPLTTVLELAFVIAAGPGFATIVFTMLGRFWRTECYMAALFQACYVPFELLNWMLEINSGRSELAIWLGLLVVIVPFLIGAIKILNRIMWPK